MGAFERYRDELQAEANRLRDECELLANTLNRLEAALAEANEVRYELTDKGRELLDGK